MDIIFTIRKLQCIDILVDKDNDKKENQCVVFLYFILVHKKIKNLLYNKMTFMEIRNIYLSKISNTFNL